ncbi:MAG: PHB depolymerase family esterase [Burkholderiales bacterium]
MSIQTISDTIDRALSAAGLDSKSGSVKTVMETIRAALDAAGLRQSGPGAPTAERQDAPPRQGRFLSRSHSGPAGDRAYKVFIPAAYRGEPMPLIVMLHGCKQNPDDFAAGTRMNELAEEHGFLVAYPAQSANANGSNCWNWFQAKHQQRDGGEPSILVGIVAEIADDCRVDPRRVYVAGLSAGAAMAVILGVTHADVFAAVGAHSGLPFGAAHDVGSAFAAMHGGTQAPAAPRGVPTIVFHGDHDTTVSPKNGAAIFEQAVASLGDQGGAPLTRHVREHASAPGRRFTSTVCVDRAGDPRAEQWILHGAGHAWSGGSAAGSYADEKGPDASAEMVRFFMAQRRG